MKRKPSHSAPSCCRRFGLESLEALKRSLCWYSIITIESIAHLAATALLVVIATIAAKSYSHCHQHSQQQVQGKRFLVLLY